MKLLKTSKKLHQIDKKILKAISEHSLLDEGKIRNANKMVTNEVNQWIKKVILLSFRTNKMFMLRGRIPLGMTKFQNQ